MIGEIKSTIKLHILTGYYLPGQFLSPSDIARLSDWNETTTIQSFSSLHDAQFITFVENGLYRVRTWSSEELRNLFLKTGKHCRDVVVRAIQRMSDEELALLADIVKLYGRDHLNHDTRLAKHRLFYSRLEALETEQTINYSLIVPDFHNERISYSLRMRAELSSVWNYGNLIRHMRARDLRAALAEVEYQTNAFVRPVIDDVLDLTRRNMFRSLEQ